MDIDKFSIGFDHRDRERLHALWDTSLDAEQWSDGPLTAQFEELWARLASAFGTSKSNAPETTRSDPATESSATTSTELLSAIDESTLAELRGALAYPALIADADTALYEAKRAGRNRVVQANRGWAHRPHQAAEPRADPQNP